MIDKPLTRMRCVDVHDDETGGSSFVIGYTDTQHEVGRHARNRGSAWGHTDPATHTPDSADVELAVEVFSMLADATRIRIILALRAGKLPVNTLAEIAGESPAAVSQHLAKLQLATMVLTRQEGTRVFYRLAKTHASDLVADAIRQAEHIIAAAPGHEH